MEIAFHVGANCTDDDRLLRSLMRDARPLSEAGVAVPGPSRYRKPLRGAVGLVVAGATPAAGVREELLDGALDGAEPSRVVFSNSNFLAFPARAIGADALYEEAGPRIAALASLFPGDRLEAFLAFRNPATFVPAVLSLARGGGPAAAPPGLDPLRLRWSDVVRRMREAAPDVPLTVWCNEDTPLIWGELLARLGGGWPGVVPAGRHDLLAAIMSPEGTARFQGYMADHPDQTIEQERRVASAFLDKFALSEETWDEVDLPGWDAALVDRVTRAYEADMDLVAGMEGVTFVAP